MSSYSTADHGRGGLRALVSATLWTACSIGVVTAVMIWAFDLGSRNPADIPALSAAGDWRQRPADPEGRKVPGSDRLVYGPVAGAPSGASAAVSNAFSAAPVERAPTEDFVNAPPLAEIAPDRGESINREAFADLSRKTAETEANARRTILLDDPLQPQRSARDYSAPGAPGAPANVGTGSEPPPANAAFYGPDGATGDTAVAPRAASPETGTRVALAPSPSPSSPASPPSSVGAASPLTTDMPPDAEPAAMTPGGSGSKETTASPAETPPEPAAAAAASIDTAIAELAPAAPPDPTAEAEPNVFQVQLAALDSVRAVEQRWDALKAREPELLGSFPLEIKPVNVGGSRLYRLRVGSFGSRSEAARLCVILRERGVECFPASGG